MSDLIDDPDERWRRTFHPDDVPGVGALLDPALFDAAAAITSAQLAIDAGVLAALDGQLSDPTCEHQDGCTFPAIVQVRCRHTGSLVGLLCGAHLEQTKALRITRCPCGKRGAPEHLFLMRTIFNRRSKA